MTSDIGEVESTVGVQRCDDGSSSCVCRQARRVESGTLGRALDDLGDRLSVDEPARSVGEHRRYRLSLEGVFRPCGAERQSFSGLLCSMSAQLGDGDRSEVVKPLRTQRCE